MASRPKRGNETMEHADASHFQQLLTELLAKLAECDAKIDVLVSELKAAREQMAAVQAELIETIARWEPPVEPFPNSVWPSADGD